MQPRFAIDVDPARDLVRLTLAGFFAPEDVQRFESQRDAAHARLTCPPNAHLTLADVRDMPAQPQPTVAAFGTVLAKPAQQSRRLALVFASPLFKQQLARAADGRRVRFFTDADAAEHWLFTSEAE